MKIGLVREIKEEEYRVGLTPQSAREYLVHEHEVLVEPGAGEGSGFSDKEYQKVGCRMEPDKHRIFEEAEMLVHVKEPMPEEYDLLHEGQILFTYLHLAANKRLTQVLLDKKVTAVAYETVREADGSLPLLIPMSQIAGRLAVQEGAKYLEKPFGGRGILLGGVPGLRKGKVVIIGGGIVGTNACKIAVGLHASVSVLEISPERLAYLDDVFGASITTLYSNRENLKESLREADVVIGAVLIPGGDAAPKLIRRRDLKLMRKGAVIVDVAVDQGGCVETTRPTTHKNPTYIVDGVVHYCVANMPGAVALSSTRALTMVTNTYGLRIADLGIEKAVETFPPILAGLNTYRGKLTNRGVAGSLGIPHTPYA